MTRKTIAFLFTVLGVALVVACSSNPVVQVGGGQDPPLTLDSVEGGGSPEGSVHPPDAGTSDANPEDSSVDSSPDAATDGPISDSATDSSPDAADSAAASDGGADASGDAVVDAAPVCTVGDTQCVGKVPQTCEGVDGGVAWKSQAACSFDCLDGRCIECNRGADCTLPSASFCVDGACRECNPGSLRCSSVGQNRQKCMGGAWEVIEICPFACLPSSVRCDGNCVPGTRRCNPDKIDLGEGVFLDSTQECDQGVWVERLRCNRGSSCDAARVTCNP